MASVILQFVAAGLVCKVYLPPLVDPPPARYTAETPEDDMMNVVMFAGL